MPGCLVVVEYKVAWKALRYLGLVQNTDENGAILHTIPAKKWRSTVTVMVGDRDMITKDKIIRVIDSVNYKINNWGQYIVNHLATI